MSGPGRDTIAAVAIGAMLGVAMVGYFFAYLPMKGNYEQCGKVTLCPIELARERFIEEVRRGLHDDLLRSQ